MTYTVTVETGAISLKQPIMLAFLAKIRETLEPPRAQDETCAPPTTATWVVLLAALAIVGFLYWDVFVWLSGMWRGRDHSHCYFVPLFSLYVIWTQRQELTRIVGVGHPNRDILAGILLIFAGLTVRLVGIYTRILTLEGLSLIPMLFGIVSLAIGLRVAVKIWAPLLFLAFMVPLPGALAGRMGASLQFVATHASTFGLQTLGIPAVSEGNVILLEAGEIGVAEACSGLRMLYAFFALTVGSCMVIDRYWWEKLLVIASAVPIAIIANCIRIIATGGALRYFDKDTAEFIFHDLAGWLMMPIGFGLLAILLWLMDKTFIQKQSPEDDGDAALEMSHS
jgi:exosortase